MIISIIAAAQTLQELKIADSASPLLHGASGSSY
jgi:hypothetical protein